MNATPWLGHSKDGGPPVHSQSSPFPGTLPSRTGTFPPQGKLGVATLPDLPRPSQTLLPEVACHADLNPLPSASAPLLHPHPTPLLLDWDKRFLLRSESVRVTGKGAQ